ncbi:hypothetical protein WJX73_008194 [Symbiochloris irregularis]|uniref:Uncharacterized protein n=1 Tax=Symbiochloris irregularis TaxID=706552 RepID=A0AAW1P9L6_9CHLO
MAYKESTACRSWLCCLNCSTSRLGCRTQFCCIHLQCGDPAFSVTSGRQKCNINLCFTGFHSHGIPSQAAVMNPNIEPVFNAPPLQNMTQQQQQQQQQQQVAVGYPAQQQEAGFQKSKPATSQSELQANAGSAARIDKMGDRIPTSDAGQPSSYPAPPTNSAFQ